MKKLSKFFYEILLDLPVFRRFIPYYYKRLGVIIEGQCFIDQNVQIIGNYENLRMANGSSLRNGVLITVYDQVKIGENTGVAYNVSILTSSVPTGPRNKLFKLYPRIKKPVIIGDNCWIGTGAIIFPGVTIGNCCIIAAGSLVKEDVADYSIVAGVPSKIIKKLNPADLK